MHIGLFDPEWRGHHTPYATLLCQGLLDSGHQVTFFTAPNHPHLDEFPEHERFTLVELTTETVKEGEVVYIKKIRDQWAKTEQLTEAVHWAEKQDIDVLHLLCLDFMHIPTLVTSLRCRSTPPLVASLHRDIPFDQNYAAETFGAKIRSTAEQALMRSNRWAQSRLLQNGTICRQVVHAERMRDRVLSKTRGANGSNTVTIPAPTPDIPAVSQTEAREDLGLPKDTPIFLFFGALRYDKGPDLLVKALDGIEEPLTVLLAGKEAYFDRNDVEEWQDSVETRAEVETRLEYIPESEVDRYFVAADVLVLPYRREYGISGPLRRGVMAGTYIVGSDRSDIGSIIQRHDIGETFKRGDADSLGQTIESIVSNDGVGTGNQTSARAEEIHWKSVVNEFEKVYKECI